MRRKAMRRPSLRLRKQKAPQKRGNGTCDCLEAKFALINWGTPTVFVGQQSSPVGSPSPPRRSLTMTVPYKYVIRCAKTSVNQMCTATLKPQVTSSSLGRGEDKSKRRFDPPDASLTSICDRKRRTKSGSFRYETEFATEGTINGSITLTFTLSCGGTDETRDTVLVIRNSGLDEDESDYDGDGKKNKAETDARWDPDR